MVVLVGLFLVRLELITAGQGILAAVAFLNEFSVLFRYPPRSALALLGGTVPLRYCAARFASEISSWRLLTSGRVADLVTDGGVVVGIVWVEPCVQDSLDDRAGVYCLHDGVGVDWASGPGVGGKRLRQHRTTPAHFVNRGFWGSVSRPRVWQRLRVCGQRSAGVDAKRRRLHLQAEVLLLVRRQDGGWLSSNWGMHGPTLLGLLRACLITLG